jgi:hypothetical protein
MGRRRGRGFRRRARVRACWSTVGAGKAELTGGAHDTAREKVGTRGNGFASGEAGVQGREGRGARRRREPALTAWPH